MPGNIASAVEDAGGGVTSVRANLANNPDAGQNKLNQFAAEPTDANGNPTASAAFQPPDLGSTYWSDPAVAKRGALTGPSTWGVNLGLHKNFHITDRITMRIGADADNVFNHAMPSPSNGSIGTQTALEGFGTVGTINMLTQASVDGVSDGTPLINTNPGGLTPGMPGGPAQPALLPVTSVGNGTGGSSTIVYNPAFGLKNVSYEQEGISGNREIRLLGRIYLLTQLTQRWLPVIGSQRHLYAFAQVKSSASLSTPATLYPSIAALGITLN